VSCRCGAPPEKKCAECGRQIDAELGRCRAHPALDLDAVRCVRCGRHLCAFHMTVTPVSKAGGGIGLGEKCFPSCASTFGVTPIERPRHVSPRFAS
jgi:hypothetical protein